MALQPGFFTCPICERRRLKKTALVLDLERYHSGGHAMICGVCASDIYFAMKIVWANAGVQGTSEARRP